MGKYYIAYGSNLNLIQMAIRCPSARKAGTAVLNGWGLIFKGSKTGSYLTIEPRSNGCVPVAIWEVTENDERALDLYEGFPTFYYKKDMVVTMDDGKKINAFVYIMRENAPIGIPSKEYVAICRGGYHFNDFDSKYLDEAIKESERRMAQ